MFGRPSFGVSQPNTFGFGNTSSTPFGQNQLFGNTSAGTFGSSSSTSGFGSSSQPMFGTTQQPGSTLFGSSSTPSFGQTNQSSFGSSPFGSSTQQTSGTGLFGTSGSTFGQQNKPSGFGFSSSSTGGLFGQNAQQSQQGTSMFQPSSSGGLFGSSSTFGSTTSQAGTPIKFTLVTGTDSMQKAGVAHTISTKHHCITCMKEYENKSLEELRWEDYQCNRKGPQQQPGFGTTTPFGQTSSTAPSLFGQTENKTVFGQSSTAFGQTPGFGLTSQSSAQNIFGKPATAFGTTTTASTFGFGTNTSSTGGLFGSSNTAKPFGAPANQTLFGTNQTQPNTAFGTSNIFGQTNTQNTGGGIFGKPTQPTGFNTGQSGFSFGAPQQTQTNLFQNTNKPNTGFSIFGPNSSGNTSFGQQPSTFGGFNAFSKPTQNTFGQPSQPSFGLGLQSGGSIFGNTNVKPSGNLFGTSGSTNLFGNNNFQTNSGFNLPVQQQQPQPQNLALSTESQSQDFRNIVQMDPYGYSPHLEGLSPVKPPETTYVTNPKEIQKLLDVPQTINISPVTKRMKVLPAATRKATLFDDVMDKQTTDMNFTLRTSAKRLMLKKDKTASPLSALHESFSSISLPLTDNYSVNGSSSDLVNIKAPSKSNGKEGPNFVVPPLNLTEITGDDEPYKLLSNKENTAQNKNDLLDETPTPDTNKNNKVGFTTQDIISPVFEHGDPPILEKQNKPVDTCGVVLSRPEYYTIPPLEKLIEHKQSDGSCLIKGFTIGRVGYGSVSFPDLMDIANLNLDELVHFRYRELTIYPEDASKPPLGQGLNRHAQVTLDRVYPKSKTDRSLITNVDTLIAINFSDTLRDICERHGTKFLDYRPDTGSWVFTVDHFSKYGFSDSDDDEINEKLLKLKETQAKQLAEKKKLEAKETKEIESEKAAKAIEIMEEESLKDIAEKELDSQDEYIQRKGLGGLTDISDNIEDIDIDFPHSLSASQLHQVETRRSLYKTRGNLIYLMKASLFDEESLPGDVYTDTEVLESEELFKDFEQPHIMQQRKEKVQVEKAEIFSLFNKSCNISIEKSVLNCRNYMDMAIFKGRSFKIGWGKGLVLATTLTPATRSARYINESTLENRSSIIAVFDVAKIVNEEAFVDSLPEHLRIILETSDVNIINGVPLFKAKTGKSALLRHQFLATETAQQNMSNEMTQYHKEIWDLCLAFWGPIVKPETQRSHFSKWLESVTRKKVLSDLSRQGICGGSESLFVQFFIHLSGHQIQEAAELAISNKMPRLSLLISQLNLNCSLKSAMQMQMKQWMTSQSFDYVDKITQKIYMILSGIPIDNRLYNTELGPVNVCEDLDWKRTLAVYFWYMTPSAYPLDIAINLYTEAFDKYGYVVRPTSKYKTNFQDSFDIQYHLMMLYCNNKRPLEVILNPNTHTHYPYDYRLSWLLLQTLASLQVGIISTRAKNYITTSFSAHLENLGLHKWAVFVLLFIEDEVLKKNLVMGVLDRNIQDSPTDTEIEDEIVQDFCVPSSWIHEVKSNKTMLLTRYWEAYRHLAFTQKWYDCHNVGIMHVLPQLIINEDYDVLKILLETLEQGHEIISNWKYQGGLLLDFVKLIAMFDKKNRLSRDTALATHSTLLELCSRLPMFPTRYSNQVACVSEISKHCFVYLRLLLSYINPTYYGIFAISSAQMEEFIMPPDYKMEELLKSVSTYVQEA